jgi:hypothetical protein
LGHVTVKGEGQIKESLDLAAVGRVNDYDFHL